jgi:hypothetical protein
LAERDVPPVDNQRRIPGQKLPDFLGQPGRMDRASGLANIPGKLGSYPSHHGLDRGRPGVRGFVFPPKGLTQLREDRPRISRDAHIHGTVLPDLLLLNIHLDDLDLGMKMAGVRRRSSSPLGSHDENHIGW